MTKRKGSLKPASDVLQSLLSKSKSPLGNQFQRWRLWRDWEKVVGATLAQHCMPVQLAQGILYLWVENGAWLQQISFLEEPLRNKINEYFGYTWISRIRFTLDRRSVPNPRESDLGSQIDPSK